LDIIVCVKQINDPEAPSSDYVIDEEKNRIVFPHGAEQPVISPFDEYAVEAGLRIKEATGGKITALSLGCDMSRNTLKKTLAMGVDDLVLLEDPAFADGDDWSTAYALCLAVKKFGKFDMILCGRQAADQDSGQTGLGIAQILGLPCVTIARKVSVEGNKAIVERVIKDGFETVEVELPAVITVGNEHDEPRYPNVAKILASKRKDPIVWTPSDIGADPDVIGSSGRRVKTVRLFQPIRETNCQIFGGDTLEETVSSLVDKLKDDKLL
jgi:electron transfer flavoprotein beta subunit